MADPAGTEEWTASCSECRFFRDGYMSAICPPRSCQTNTLAEGGKHRLVWRV